MDGSGGEGGGGLAPGPQAAPGPCNDGFPASTPRHPPALYSCSSSVESLACVCPCPPPLSSPAARDGACGGSFSVGVRLSPDRRRADSWPPLPPAVWLQAKKCKLGVLARHMGYPLPVRGP